MCLAILLGPATTARAQKEALYESIRARDKASWDMALKIWAWAEPGYQEKRSAALLADALEKGGFKVERGVAKIPTAFTATIGSGKPVIGILGEYLWRTFENTKGRPGYVVLAHAEFSGRPEPLKPQIGSAAGRAGTAAE